MAGPTPAAASIAYPATSLGATGMLHQQGMQAGGGFAASGVMDGGTSNAILAELVGLCFFVHLCTAWPSKRQNVSWLLPITLLHALQYKSKVHRCCIECLEIGLALCTLLG